MYISGGKNTHFIESKEKRLAFFIFPDTFLARIKKIYKTNVEQVVKEFVPFIPVLQFLGLNVNTCTSLA